MASEQRKKSDEQHETVARRVGLPGPSWLDVVDTYRGDYRAIVGHVAPVVGMTNSNIVIVRVENGRYLTRHRGNSNERAIGMRSGMVIDAAEAARFGWDGDVRLRRAIACATTETFMRKVGDVRLVIENGEGRYCPGEVGHRVVRYNLRVIAVPLYSVNGSDPVCIEAAAKLIGVR